MATTQQIEDAVDNGKLYYLKQLAKQRLLMQNGCGSLKDITPVKRLILGLTFQLRANVNDADTSMLYNCLIRALGGFAGNYQLDPDVSLPGQTTVVVNVISQYHSDMIPFASGINIADYQNGIVPLFGGTWASRYGNTPELWLYSNQGVLLVGEEQTPPQRTYAVANDPTSNLLSILYDLPPGTSVYLQISGTSSTSGNAQGGGNLPPALPFTQADLLQDENDLWYLPLVISPLRDVAVVTSNDITVAGWTYNRSDYSPGRVYGFSNNDSQAIKVKII